MKRLSDWLPRLWTHWLSLTGTILTTIGGLLIGGSFVVYALGGGFNVYATAALFFAAPAVFLGGLLLIPLGLVLARRRTKAAQAEEESLRAAFAAVLARPVVRRRLAFFVVASVVNVALVALAATRAIAWMDSPEFCGTLCHSVMQPEWDAYRRSPHARVACVDCHIGPGASWAVKSKIDGLRQVWGVLTDDFHRPIPAPVAELRPARDTCEQCHWPAKFHGTRLKTFRRFGDDEANTETASVVALRIGGAEAKSGAHVGIHWHVNPNIQVLYEDLDGKRGAIGSVTVLENGALKGVYRRPDEKRQAATMRTMDCVDCHNRPTHIYDASPRAAVDDAFAAGLLDPGVPYLHKIAVELLTQRRPERAQAERVFRDGLAERYAALGPDKAPPAATLDGAAKTLADLYRRNVYPDMRIAWGTYPSHLGHGADDDLTRGCFRCHDEQHQTAAGNPITQDCGLCHELLEDATPAANLPPTIKSLLQ